MVINFVVNEVAGGWEPTDARLGGTEEAVVRWAEEFVKQDHEVRVYRNGHGGFHAHNGVHYEDRELYGQHGGDICINVKSSEIPPKEPTIYFTNELNASDLDLSKYDAVVWPSNWAKDNIPVNNKNVYVVPHGYDETRIYPGKKIPKQCLYASSPDRGLDLLLSVWPEVYQVHPDATLIVTYGAEGRIPGVTFLGSVDEDFMDELYRTSEFWVHPCTGVELFCITGLKAQAAGCWPVIIPAMALQETVHFGDFATEDDYADTLIHALGKRHIIPSTYLPTYKTSADELMKIIRNVVK